MGLGQIHHHELKMKLIFKNQNKWWLKPKCFNPPTFMVTYRMLVTIGVTNFTLVKV